MDMDPEMNALNDRRAKLHITIEVKNPDQEEQEGDDAHPDEEQDKELISQMLSDERKKDEEQDAALLAKDQDDIKNAAMGGESADSIMEQYKNRAPKSLGEKVKLAMAQKK